MQVEKIKTPTNAQTIEYAFASIGYPFDTEISRKMFMAHLRLEHSANLEFIYNNNVGNIMLWRDPSKFPWFYLTDRNTTKARYQSHNSIVDGMRDYANEMKRRPSVVSAANDGDVSAFVKALYDTEYIGVPGGSTKDKAITDTTNDILYLMAIPNAPKTGPDSSGLLILTFLVASMIGG